MQLPILAKITRYILVFWEALITGHYIITDAIRQNYFLSLQYPTMTENFTQLSAGRPEMVVGWYHSHPGFGCWLSGVDINTQQSFEALTSRAVAVVVDPIQSVKGKVGVLAKTLVLSL